MNVVKPMPAAVTPGFPVMWSMLGRLIVQLLGAKAHADVVIQIKDGNVQIVRVNQSFLPSNLPQV